MLSTGLPTLSSERKVFTYPLCLLECAGLAEKNVEVSEIEENSLGWDITDFGK